MTIENAEKLLSFIQKSPSCFHAIKNIENILQQNGFQGLLESEKWQLLPDKKYYTIRNGSSIIAFKTGENLDDYNFNIVSSHSDSPTFKIKENAQLEINAKYTKLNTEGYGGMLCATWFDRPLSIAGRVLVKKEQTFETILVDIDRDLLTIPNVAIHLNRGANDGFAYNKQVDLLPLLSGKPLANDTLKEMIAHEVKCNPTEIYGMDLFLYNRMAPSIWGYDKEFLSAPKLDDLECAYTTLQGFLSGSSKKAINVYCCFDNEEVGSMTKQGADSTFLHDVLDRINTGLNKEKEAFYQALASSFMISADNGHAVHPNHPELTDANNCTYMNDGIVIKFSANQKYTSDALSVALFKNYCDEANVPYQYFANRSDMMGGSTLGNIAAKKVSIPTVDIGLAQLAMHSSYECAGVKDVDHMIHVISYFYSCFIREVGNGQLHVEK